LIISSGIPHENRNIPKTVINRSTIERTVKILKTPPYMEAK